jgi:hypothetical protein
LKGQQPVDSEQQPVASQPEGNGEPSQRHFYITGTKDSQCLRKVEIAFVTWLLYSGDCAVHWFDHHYKVTDQHKGNDWFPGVMDGNWCLHSTAPPSRPSEEIWKALERIAKSILCELDLGKVTVWFEAQSRQVSKD